MNFTKAIIFSFCYKSDKIMELKVLTLRLKWVKTKINPVNYRYEITEQLNNKFGGWVWLRYKIVSE